MNLSELREQALERANYKCEWAYCDNTHIRLELAHIQAIGMGGSKKRKFDIDNVCILCKHHHDIYDGRRHNGAGFAYRELLTAYLQLSR